MDDSAIPSREERESERLGRQLVWERTLLGTLLLVCVLLLYQSLLARRVTAIALDGVEVVYVADHRVADRVLAEMRQEQGIVPGLGIRFDQRVTTYSVLRRRHSLATLDEAKQTLTRRLEVLVQAYALRRPDGSPMVWALTQDVMTAALDELKAALCGRVGVLVEEPRVIDATLDRTVHYVPIDAVKTSAEEVVDVLLDRRTTARQHEVRRGEVAGGIARRYGLTLAQLKAMNPNRNLSLIHPGDRLTIESEAIEPKVTVESLEEVQEEEEITPPVEEVVRPELKAGEKRLVQAGTPGKRRVRIHWRCRNGERVSRTVVDEQVLVPARPARVEVGTARP